MTFSSAWIAQGGATPARGAGHAFDGSTGVAVLNQADAYDEANWSIFAEIYADAEQSATVFSFSAAGLDQSGGAQSEYLALRVIESGIQLKVQLQLREADGTITTITSTQRFPRRRYTRLLLTAGTGKLYINGVLDPTDFTFTKPSFTGLNRSLIGARIEGGAFADFFDGYVRDLRLYGSELSQANATALETDRLMPTAAISADPSFVRAGKATIRPEASIDAKPKLKIKLSASLVGRASVASQVNGRAVIQPTAQVDAVLGFTRLGRAVITPEATLAANMNLIRPGRAVIGPEAQIDAVGPVISIPGRAVIRPEALIVAKMTGKSLITGGTAARRPHNRRNQIEIHDADGTLLRILSTASDARLPTRVNRPDLLTFEVKIDREISDLLVQGKQIWVRRMRDDRVISVCDFKTKEEFRRGETPMAAVQADGILARLNNAIVDSYTPPASPANTYKRVIEDLLALQLGSTPITLHPGSNFPDGEWTDTFPEGFTVLQALQVMASLSNYQMRVDEALRLQFVETIEPDQATTRRVRYGKNLISLKKRYDARKLVTRVFAYGAGQGAARVRLSQADGHETDYLDSENYDENDPHEGYLFLEHIEDPNQLLKAAQEYLAKHDTPKVEYEITQAEAIQQ